MIRPAPLRAAAVVLAAALGLSGCVASAPDITASTSELMQSTIVAAADQAAAGDAAGSLTTLDSLEAQLDSAIDSGAVSAARAGRIQDAIDLVRADLQPAPAETPAPLEAPVPEESTAPVETTTETDVPDPGEDSGGDSGDDESGNGNNGNGNGNNGNGNGKGKDK